MEILTNAAAFVVVLGLMIFFHEFGHFTTAKAFGMRVFVFSFGFGKRLLGRPCFRRCRCPPTCDGGTCFRGR